MAPVSRRAALAFLASAALPLPAYAARKDDPHAALRGSLQTLVDEGRIPGAVLLVGRGGRILHHTVVGWQDVAARTPMRRDTIFRFYSMSKPITSIAIMALVDQGKLKLDDPVERTLPELADLRVYSGGGLADMQTVPAARSITIADLLTHRSGIIYHFTGAGPVQQYYRAHGVMRDTPVGRLPTDAPPAPNLTELVRRIGQAPLLHQPGAQFVYSYSTTVLGAVIERVTGERLDVALDRLVFAPLRMKDTGFFITEGRLGRFVTNYVATPGGLQAIETPAQSDYRDLNRLLDGGGALAGTADDYYRFGRMVAGRGAIGRRRILSPALMAETLATHATVDGMGPRPFQFGYGFQRGDAASEAAGQLPNGAVGWSGSGNTYFWVDPQTDGIVVFMTQVLTPPGFEALSLRLREAIMGPALKLIGEA
ncbi:MAG: beta-lactamase family protein [Hyphomonadaceae bacterium]|nr:beta-lactamase family protein [Hyphomonadaceae bacterium]